MIKTFTPPTSMGQPSDDYKYLGYASFLDMVPDKTFDEGNYRYLVMKYTGDITQLRFQFNRKDKETGADELEGPYWFNPEGQTFYFVTADGSDIPLIGDNTLIVIDLAKSVNPEAIDGSGLGVGLDWFNSGIHMHCDEMIKHGDGKGFTISYACLTNTIPSEEDIPDVTLPEESKPSETTAAPEETKEAVEGMRAIILDGGEEGKSTLIKRFTNDKETVLDADGNVVVGKDGYKWLGYVTFKDLADKDFKYMALTYTGDITNFRLQFVHDASGNNEEMSDIFWFDPEQEIHFVTADGSEIPLVGNNTTVIIDLEKSGVNIGWYNSGLHVHVNDIADINITYAALLTELPKDGEPLPTEDIIDPSKLVPPSSKADGNNGKTPSTGDNMPVKAVAAVCVLSLVILGGAIVVRRREFK